MQGKCPICPRGCDLNAPSCPRGKEYVRTGNIPSQPKGRLSFKTKDQAMVMKYLHHAIRAIDSGVFKQEDADNLFEILSKEETATLAMLLEKTSNYWLELKKDKEVL